MWLKSQMLANQYELSQLWPDERYQESIKYDLARQIAQDMVKRITIQRETRELAYPVQFSVVSSPRSPYGEVMLEAQFSLITADEMVQLFDALYELSQYVERGRPTELLDKAASIVFSEVKNDQLHNAINRLRNQSKREANEEHLRTRTIKNWYNFPYPELVENKDILKQPPYKEWEDNLNK